MPGTRATGPEADLAEEGLGQAEPGGGAGEGERHGAGGCRPPPARPCRRSSRWRCRTAGSETLTIDRQTTCPTAPRAAAAAATRAAAPPKKETAVRLDSVTTLRQSSTVSAPDRASSRPIAGRHVHSGGRATPRATSCPRPRSTSDTRRPHRAAAAEHHDPAHARHLGDLAPHHRGPAAHREVGGRPVAGHGHLEEQPARHRERLQGEGPGPVRRQAEVEVAVGEGVEPAGAQPGPQPGRVRLAAHRVGRQLEEQRREHLGPVGHPGPERRTGLERVVVGRRPARRRAACSACSTASTTAPSSPSREPKW